MSESLKVGIAGESRTVASEKNSALTYGSGGVEVLATPAMIALMENTALNLVQPYLNKGQSTVGIRIESSHIAATPLGMEVVAKAELIEIDGKKLIFRVEAFDEKDKIGEGKHERFIIDVARFMQKVSDKSTK